MIYIKDSRNVWASNFPPKMLVRTLKIGDKIKTMQLVESLDDQQVRVSDFERETHSTIFVDKLIDLSQYLIGEKSK